jgi:hypothetical protein
MYKWWSATCPGHSLCPVTCQLSFPSLPQSPLLLPSCCVARGHATQISVTCPIVLVDRWSVRKAVAPSIHPLQFDEVRFLLHQKARGISTTVCEYATHLFTVCDKNKSYSFTGPSRSSLQTFVSTTCPEILAVSSILFATTAVSSLIPLQTQY